MSGVVSILSTSGARRNPNSIQRILALYGGGDVFALTTGRYRRFFERVRRDWGDKLTVREISDGGHFWGDPASKRELIQAVQAFIHDS